MLKKYSAFSTAFTATYLVYLVMSKFSEIQFCTPGYNTEQGHDGTIYGIQAFQYFFLLFSFLHFGKPILKEGYVFSLSVIKTNSKDVPCLLPVM